MSEADPPRPIHRKRTRLAHAFRSIKSRLSLYRSLFAAAAAVAVVLTAMLAFTPGDAPEAVSLGKGQASVRTPETTPAAAPAPTPAGEGEASFYGDELAGRPTASGERFDPAKLTAAHRTLPLGSRVRVTHARTGESVVVRINDRGPFHGQRVIDLSKAAARRIGLDRKGTARVKLELLRN